jgi:Uma2 family endonuclease
MTATVSNAFTVDDLEAMPDDGKRYELIGGAIVMTPAPEPVHQRVSGEIFVLLRAACPPGHQVFCSPIDLDMVGGQRVEPDVIVVPHESVGDKRLSGPALLVVEIVSPGSAVNDRVTKREVYAKAGVPAYWIVDPREGRIVALRLVGGSYEVYADSAGPVEIDWPVAVAFSVADLARPPAG